MSDLAREAAAALARGPAALVTVLATEGSAPRGAGARMLVSADGQAGTIGGGRLEWQVAAQARAMLALPEGTWRVQDYPLGPLLGQCCGGRVRVLVERLAEVAWLGAVEGGGATIAQLADDRIFRTPSPVRADLVESASLTARGPLPAPGMRFVEPVDTPRRPVLLFGAGHVGAAIARVADGVPLQIGWYDSRPEMAPLPGVVQADEDAMVACAAQAGEGCAVLILTHDHGLDYRLTAAALGSRAAFVGLIGSATKRARFVARLASDGVDPARLTCPIGLAGIAGKAPATIAVATVAQLLALPA